MMSIRSMAVVAVAGALLALAAGCGGGGGEEVETAPPATTEEAASAETAAGEQMGAATLTGTVGPDFTITLTQDGAPVGSLAPGTYEIVVDDMSSSHNFHLMGPGVDEATDVGETGTTTWTVTLEPGEYTFQCDPHASSMNGSFTVG